MKKLSLKAKIITLTLGCVISLGIGGQFLFSRAATASKKATMGTFGSYAEALNSAIAAQFFERYGDIQAFAANPGLKSNDRNEIVSHLNTYVKLYGIYDLIYVVDAQGKLVAVNDVNPAGEKIDVSSLYSKSYSETEWFKAVIAGKFTEDASRGFRGTYFEDGHRDPGVMEIYKTDGFGTSFSAPITDAKGRTIGVVSNRAGMRWVESEFKTLYGRMKAKGLAHSEYILARADGVQLVNYDPYAQKTEDLKRNFDIVLKDNFYSKVTEIAEQVRAGKAGHLLFNDPEEGGKKVLGYSPVNDSKFIPSIGWSVVVGDHSDELFAELNEKELLFQIVFGLNSLIAFLASFYFATAISRSIEALSKRLSEGANEVEKSADGLASASQQLSASAEEQAAALQETVASLDEVSAMVGKNSENAVHSKEISGESRQAAEAGKSTVTQMLQSIDAIQKSNDDIAAQMEKSNAEISQIVKVIGEIGAKTKVINDIVFQTKLLSFNASVEAARAGEHGKGFAVVAEEVGNLAQMSGNASKEIATLLEESTSKVQSIVSETQSRVTALIEVGKQRVAAGIDQAQQCERVLEEIVTKVVQVNTMVEEIATASKEQEQGVSEIAKAMNQLDQVTQQNTAVSQECSDASHQLNQQTQGITQVLGQLDSMVTGKETGGSSVSSAPTVTKERKPASKASRVEKKLKLVEAKTAEKRPAEIPSSEDTRFEDVA